MNFTGVRDLITWDPDEVLIWARSVSGQEPKFSEWLSDLAAIFSSHTEEDLHKFNAAVALFYMPPVVFSLSENLPATLAVVRGLIDQILNQHCDKDLHRLANQALVVVSKGFVNQPILKV